MAADREFRVLVATDGSAPAKTAVATAVRFPWPVRTRAQGVTAREVPADYRRSILLAALDRSANVIATGARRALSRRWPGADVTIVDTAPVAGVLHEAKRFDADVIVLGWRGHGAVRRFLMGSVSRGVVRGAKCAVLVVRRGQRDVRRIVIGFDGSVNAQRAVDFVGRLHPPRGGQVIVFTAVDHVDVPSQALAPRGVGATVAAEVRRINAERTARAKKDLVRADATLTRAGWGVRTRVTEGAPLRDLLAAVDSAGADLLVLGARGASDVLAIHEQQPPRCHRAGNRFAHLNNCPWRRVDDADDADDGRARGRTSWITSETRRHRLSAPQHTKRVELYTMLARVR